LPITDTEDEIELEFDVFTAEKIQVSNLCLTVILVMVLRMVLYQMLGYLTRM